MHSFLFNTTPQLVVGIDSTTQSHEWQARLAGLSVLVITDQGLVNAGVVKPVLAQLNTVAKQVVLYSDVLADPPVYKVNEAIAFAESHQTDVVIGLGGGSSLDTAKLVALLCHSTQKIEDVMGVNKASGTRLPLIQIPTTAGTGSEVTPIAIVTTATDEKVGIVSPLLYPDLAVLDAALTQGLPPAVTAMTGVDAMVHAIEAYTSKLKKNPISDALAKQALTLLYKNLPVVLNNPRDLAAREQMLLGSLLAGMAFANAPVGAVHALAYPIGGIFHVPHGLSNALVLTPVLQFNVSHAVQEYAELADCLPNIENAKPSGSLEEKAQWFVQQMQTLVAQMPFAQRLTEVGVNAADIPKMADDVMKIERLLINNPRPVSHADAIALYSQVL